MPASHERDRLFAKRVQQFTRMLHGLERGDGRALHRTRVATRRLRELLPVLQLDDHVATKLGRRLKRVTEQLGPVREVDVLLRIVEELRTSNRFGATSLSLIRAALEAERQGVRRRAEKRMPIASLRRLATKLSAAGAKRAARDDRRKRVDTADRGWRWAIDARIAKRAARLRTAIEAAGAVYLPERLHDVRISLKKLRYALESAAEPAGDAVRADLRMLRARQDGLGRLHDLQRLIDRARQVQASLVPPSLVTWRGLEEIVDGLEDECRRLHGRYMRQREPLLALCARLSGRGRAGASPRRVTA